MTKAASYREAISLLETKKAKAGVLTWDAGEGFRSEGFWCSKRRRPVVTLITPEGMRVQS